MMDMSNTATTAEIAIADFDCDFYDTVAGLGFGPAEFDTEGILPTWVANRYHAVNIAATGNVVGIVVEDFECGAVTMHHLTSNGLTIDEVSLNGSNVLALIPAIWDAWQ